MTVSSSIFPDMSDIPENADKFASQEFSPSNSDSMPFSFQADTADMVNPATGQLTVMGSNISDQEVDMVAVTNDQGNSGAMPLSQAFVGERFAFKFIGVKYSANGNTGAGTLNVHYEQKANRVNIS